jgi:hypothetical protein
MTVEHRGYCALGLTLDADRYVKGTTDLVVLLEPTLHVAGHVVDARGAPVPLVRIRFFARRLQHQPLGKQLTETLSVQSDAQGNFRLDGIPPCEDAVLSGDDAQEPKRIEFVPRREIGALNADLDGLVLVCPDSAVISIRVLQPDGTPVAPGLFQVVEEANLTRFAGSNWLRPDYLVRVPVGVELHFVALARTNPEEARSVMVGRRSLILSTSKPEPQEFQITLGERFDYEPPPTDAQVIDIVKPDIQATLDLRLLDKSGGPLGADTEVVLIPILGERVALHPSDGWIRLRGFPGLNSVRFQAGDESEVMEIVIPPSGYGRSERQLNIGP